MACQGLGSISPAEGAEAFLRALSHKVDRLIVLKANVELKAQLKGRWTRRFICCRGVAG